MNEMTELRLTAVDYEKAFTESCFLLDILVHAIGVVAGGQASINLAFNAGRQMGKKLPVHLDDPSLENAVRTVVHDLEAGFGIECSFHGPTVDLKVGRCAIRDVCKNRGLEPGSDLCRMFHHYLAGIASELAPGRTVKPTDPVIGQHCAFRLEAR